MFIFWKERYISVNVYEKLTMQLIKKIHKVELWKKLYTYAKVLLEQQGD